MLPQIPAKAFELEKSEGSILQALGFFFVFFLFWFLFSSYWGKYFVPGLWFS